MKVVIVGGGFGGIRSALSLANKHGIKVQLISDKSYFEYFPALYRSATGKSVLEVAIPLVEFFRYAKNVEVLQDSIVNINQHEHFVEGAEGSRYSYDKLILAMGNITEYFNIKGLDKYAHGMKSVHEALKLKRRLHEQLLENKPEQNYVIVGAGPSGIELAGELTTYLRKIRRKHKIKSKFNIKLIEAKTRPVAMMPQKFSTKISKKLRKLGVTILTSKAVLSEDFDSIDLPNQEIDSKTVVWTAGITNNKFFSKFPELFTLGRLNRVVVDDYLQAKNNIYVIGDNAVTKYSGLAQTAINDARFVCKNILRSRKDKPPLKYKPKKPIYAIPVGQRWAAVLIGDIEIYGKVGWLLRRLADLKLYISFLPLKKALSAWRLGFIDQEVCITCKKPK